MSRIRFEDTTPINKSNLDKLNNVVISPSEPTTGEEVWIQKGKNLFNINSIAINTTLYDTGECATSSVTNTSDFIPVKAGQQYTFSYEYETLLSTNNRAYNFYDKNKVFLSNYSYNTSEKIANLTPTQDGYVRIAYDKNCYNMQFEKGSKTPYEPFIRKIHTKNDNGIYEEFYNEAEHNKEIYSLGEQVIGTWIDDKPLYRNVIKGNIADNITLVSNVDTLVDAKGTGDINSIYRTIPYYEVFDGVVFALMVNKNFSNEIKTVAYLAGQPVTAPNCNIVLEYTKTTD